MNQIFLEINTDKLAKLRETSEYFKGLKSYSRSDYWKYHESLSAYKFCSNGIFIQGWSGHYYPRQKNFYNLLRGGIARRIHSASFKACHKILCLIGFDQRFSHSPKI